MFVLSEIRRSGRLSWDNDFQILEKDGRIIPVDAADEENPGKAKQFAYSASLAPRNNYAWLDNSRIIHIYRN